MLDPLAWLREHLAEVDPDPCRSMPETLAEQLMAAEAQAACNAAYGEAHAGARNARNGDRARQWDTRVGTMELAIPKLRHGSYFPEWLLEPRRPAGADRGDRPVLRRGGEHPPR
jgi:transposase-like protein